MIRHARYRDAGPIGRLLVESWPEMPYGHIPTDPGRVARFVHESIVRRERCVLVSDIDDTVRGVLIAAVAPLDICAGYGASDQAFACDSGEGAALIRAYVRWAREMGSVMTTLAVSSGSDRAGRLIQRLGFTHVGGNYILRDA